VPYKCFVVGNLKCTKIIWYASSGDHLALSICLVIFCVDMAWSSVVYQSVQHSNLHWVLAASSFL